EANFKLGRRKESHLNTEKLSKILDIEFNNAFILYNIDINFKLRQFNNAISVLNIAIKLKPNDIEMLILRGKTYLDIDDEVKVLLDNDKYQLSWVPYDFENIEVIGKGGFAIVYSAKWKRYDRLYAKLYPEDSVFGKSAKLNCVALKEFYKNDYLNEVFI
ncbi:18157_t:CDS:2, partial [Gigaspora margarita]